MVSKDNKTSVVDHSERGSERKDLPFKEATKRIPELVFAAQNVALGVMSAADYDALVNRFKPISAYDSVPAPATSVEISDALKKDQRTRVGGERRIDQGKLVALRLDIPAYTSKGVWAVSIHDQKTPTTKGVGSSIGYASTAIVENAFLSFSDTAGLRIAGGDAKAPLAAINGNWVAATAQEAKALADEALTDPDWVQVGMDPERHGYFFDRTSTEPIVQAAKIIQIGPLVLAKYPIYADKANFKYSQTAEMTSASLSSSVTEIRAAIDSAYGGLLTQLEAKGIVSISQTQEQAIDAAMQARSAKTGADVVAIKATLMGGVSNKSIGNNGHFDITNPDIRRSFDGTLQGFYDPFTRQSFLIADSLTPETAPGVLMHEVGIHMAAEGVMQHIFERAKKLVDEGQDPFLTKVRAQMYAAGETSGEEAAAYITEAYERDRVNAPKSVGQWFKDLVAAVRVWGFQKDLVIVAADLSVADIAALARANAKTMAQSGGHMSAHGDALASLPGVQLPTNLDSVRNACDVVQSGDYVGKVITVDEGVVIQKINRNGDTVAHEISQLSSVVQVGAVVHIHYHEGLGEVIGPKLETAIGR